ncbi:hypothetical protein [Streptomyces sp. NPDC012888]|uniref:hypothetical protein n=1 Tax=Streptomyces sp. NPDC012888 TaxID=3364855 RepID=UPI0036C8263D
MARNHHFHLDHSGHSITVNVGPGRSGEVELLVDGKVIAHQREHRSGTTVLVGELPEDPVRRFRVMLHQSHLVQSRLRCTCELDGVEHTMPQQPFV